MDNKFDAIVVGTGISGGWAAKELTEKGLKTLVLERGRMITHIDDYHTADMNPWDFEIYGSARAKNDGYDIVGTYGQPEQDYAIH